MAGRFVGFDIGSSSIKAVEITGKGNKMNLSSAYMLSTPEDSIIDGTIIDYAELSKSVGKVYSSGGFASQASALAIKGNDTIVKAVKVPFVSQDQFNKNMIYMAEQYMNIDLEEYSIDYQVIELDKTTALAHVLLTANRHDALSDYISIFQSADMNLKAIDLEVVALVNLYKHMQLSSEGTSLILHIGKSIVYAIFLENGEFAYYETSGSGGDLSSQVLMRFAGFRLDEVEEVKPTIQGSSDEERAKQAYIDNYFPELFDDLELAINNHMLRGGRPPEKAYLSGGGANTLGLRQALQEKFELNGTIMSPSQQINVTSPVAKQIMDQNPAMLNVAIAMALR